MPSFKRTKKILKSYALHLSHELIKIKTKGYGLEPKMGEVISILQHNPLPTSLRNFRISKDILRDPVTHIRVSSKQAMLYGIVMKMFIWSPQSILKTHSGVNQNMFFQAVNPGLEYGVYNYAISMDGLVPTDEYTFLDSFSGAQTITNTSKKDVNVSFHIMIDDGYFGTGNVYDVKSVNMPDFTKSNVDPDIEWYALKDDRS